MDGLTRDDLRRLFATEFNRALGTTPFQMERLGLIGMLTRRLSAHFDAYGWPKNTEEALVYVREAIERYG